MFGLGTVSGWMVFLATSPPMSAISIRAAIISTKRPGSRRLTQSITRRTTRRASCCRSSTYGAAGDGCPVGDRKSVVWGTSASVRVDIGGRRVIKKKYQSIKDAYVNNHKKTKTHTYKDVKTDNT